MRVRRFSALIKKHLFLDQEFNFIGYDLYIGDHFRFIHQFWDQVIEVIVFRLLIVTLNPKTILGDLIVMIAKIHSPAN